MVRFTVPIADILGNAYYRYELTSSNYNPTIDNTVTISVTVKSVFGNPINNKSVTLYQNGSSVGTATTNNTGVATFSYTFSDWDTHIFTCNGSNLELQAKGWKTYYSDSNYSIRYNNDFVVFVLTYQGLNPITDWKQFGSGALVPSNLRPYSNVYFNNAYGTVGFYVANDSGNLYYASKTGLNQSNVRVYLQTMWKHI